MYAVLLASSSAALILPVVQAAGARGPAVLAMLPQVAVADAAAIVLLPMAVDPPHTVRAIEGALAVTGAALVVYHLLAWLERSGRRRAIHHLSEEGRLAIELRASLALTFALAALAHAARVSVMLAGFAFGLALAAIGEPRRLAKQLFALTEGFFAPLFFVWLGSSLDLRNLVEHPSAIALGVALGLAAVAVHLGGGLLTRQPTVLGVLTAAQLGVPVAAVTVGSGLGVLGPGEPAALLLGALITVGATSLAGRRVAVPATEG